MRAESNRRRGAVLVVVATLAILTLVAAPNATVLLAAYAALLAVLAAVGVAFLRARDPYDREEPLADRPPMRR